MFQQLSPTDYIRAEIVCKFDKTYEKATWNERIAKFDTLNQEFESAKEMYEIASNPTGLKSAMRAYRDILQNKPTGYLVSMDASSSGIQILSLLSGCAKSFNLCGGISEQCIDSYTTLYAAMDIGGSITRKEAKDAIMTAFYGSSSIPTKTFKDNIDVFYDVVEKEAPGAWELNLGLQELWDDVKGPNYSWTLPDNHHCHIETFVDHHEQFTFMDEAYTVPVKLSEKPKFHKGIGPNIVHSVDGFIAREVARRCSFKKQTMTTIINSLNATGTNGADSAIVKTLWKAYEKSGYLSVLILDYLNEDTMGLVEPLPIAKLIQGLPEEPFDVLTIHDCFKSHPNYANDVRRQYNLALADLADSSMLEYIAGQVTDNPDLRVQKVGKINRKTILNSNYAIC